MCGGCGRGMTVWNVIVSALYAAGADVGRKVARQRIDELRSNGHELVRAIDRLLDREGRGSGFEGVKRVGKKTKR